MMNTRNLGPKESVAVKFKESKCAEFCLKLCLKATGVLAKLLSQDGFESDCPERKS